MDGKILATACMLIGVAQACNAASVGNGQSDCKDAEILKVLSFNINALPDFLKSGDREEDQYARIAEILRQRRAEGTQPQIVLLQEAFDGKASVIADTTGYGYVVHGPGRKEPSKRGRAHWTMQTRKAYSNFDDPQKFMGSGLVILSDFPILEAQHKAFDSDMCAGFDCLSNKAILLARLDVPGLGRPLDVVNSHFNSRRSAAAPDKWTLKAHQRQTDTLSWFLDKVMDGNPAILGGDFNTRAKARYSYFRQQVNFTDAAELCLSLTEMCDVAKGTPVDTILYNTNDKQFISPGGAVGLVPIHIERNFTEQIGDRGLSDHLGYEVHYQVVPAGTLSSSR